LHRTRSPQAEIIPHGRTLQRWTGSTRAIEELMFELSRYTI
jgi:hypothetical protein